MFHHFFQPIYCLTDDKMFGVEALLRSSNYPNPETMFKEARKLKQLHELDMKSIHKAILSYLEAGSETNRGYLFLNVYPSTILHPKFIPFLTAVISNTVVKSQQIILEISEGEIKEEFEMLKRKITSLKELGIGLAIDDVGKGFSNIKSIIELEPDFLKLDRYLASDLSRSAKKQSVVNSFVKYGQEFQCTIILEGIERKLDWEVAKQLDVLYGQGFGLCKPLPIEEVIV
nr:EAL domain-containing protein [Evansella tamaricis]